MVEEVDEPFRRVGHGTAAVAGHRRAEVLTQEVRQLDDGRLVAFRLAGVPVQQQVVGERDPVPRPHFEDLVPTISVEGDQRQLRFRPAVVRPLLVMPHHQLTAGVGGRQRHHQGADHQVVLLAVLMGEEELVRLVYQEGMKIGGQLGGVR